MGINVNTVYTTVLSLLNKEQRGYLTPYEFNQLATQVQLEIFENFFEDYNQYIRMPKTEAEFGSRLDHVAEEFEFFKKFQEASFEKDNEYTQPEDLYRFGSAFWSLGKNSPEIEIVSAREFTQQKLSPILDPSSDFPIAKYKQDKLTVYPFALNPQEKDVYFSYIRKPKDVKWGYNTGQQGQYIYDPTPAFGLAAILTNEIKTQPSSPTNGTYTGTVGVTTGWNTSGDGEGAAITVTVINNAIASIGATPGSGFEVGDTITVTSGVLGSSTDLVLLITSSGLLTSTAFSQNFEISDSQQTECILKILQYSGVVIRDPSIVQAAAQELAQDNANEKR